MDPATERFWRAFTSPPDDARPRVWWHWMDGNVDPEGIRLDLEWLHRVGVRGVQVFDGAMGTPLVVPERVDFGSPAWHDARRIAIDTAAALGLELEVATSPGWSAAGGPWVPPADAMRKIVWSETVVAGPDACLAPLPDVAGLFQDLPLGRADAPRDVLDWLAVAVPARPGQQALAPDAVAGSAPIEHPEALTDGTHATAASLPRDPDAASTAWIEYRFAAPARIASATVGLPGPAGFGAAPAPAAVLEASDDGRTWTPVAALPATNVPVRTAAFPPVTARRFRLTLRGEAAASALPRLAEGVRPPPVLRRVDRFAVSGLALFGDARVHAAEVKAGFGTVADYFVIDGTIDPAYPVLPDEVVDLTGRVAPDGTLDWAPPPGEWRVLRLGASLTGHTNGPAPAEATGLEVDKLDGAAVRRYLEHYLAIAAPDGVTGLLSDSIESGPQNWTPRLREEFAARRGYDLLPWVAAVTGLIVRDAAATDRFLFDLRRTIADLLADEYYGTLRDVAHARGMRYSAEALEDHRPQLGDDLAMRAAADVPMGAMWLFDAGTGAPAPTYVADLKGASSVAHVHGKAWTGAESMTAFHRPWSYAPRHLKHIADLELALGVTRFCIHTSPHQPVGTPPPGIGLAPFLGQAFLRTEPWAELAGAWIDYLARCSAVLNLGLPAVDLAVFPGEEAPLTALFGDEPDRTVPAEIGFDYIGLEALESVAVVDDGDILVVGARYRALVLGGSSRRMTCRALRRLRALVAGGATLIGTRPEGSPSLADDDEEHAALVAAVWDADPASGRVVDSADVAAALHVLGISPARSVTGRGITWVGRRNGEREITFVANGDHQARTATIRSAAPLCRWDPVTLRRSLLRPAQDAPDEYPLLLGPLESAFVIDDVEHDAPPSTTGVVEVPVDGAWSLELPGGRPVPVGPEPRHWTELGDEGFAGIGTYLGTVDLGGPVPSGRATLRLGDVGDVARVTVNGTACGIVWAPPFDCDITGALAPGTNTVVVEVANTWMNRLIIEAREPTGALFAPVAAVYLPDAPLRPAGLAGPVTMRFEAEPMG